MNAEIMKAQKSMENGMQMWQKESSFWKGNSKQLKPKKQCVLMRWAGFLQVGRLWFPPSPPNELKKGVLCGWSEGGNPAVLTGTSGPRLLHPPLLLTQELCGRSYMRQSLLIGSYKILANIGALGREIRVPPALCMEMLGCCWPHLGILSGSPTLYQHC